MKITLQLVVDAINHASDKQEEALLGWLNQDANGWAGHELGEIIKEHIESLEEDMESNRAEEFSEQNQHLPSRYLA